MGVTGLSMPLTYQIDPAQRIVTITGDYADAEGWRTLLAAIANDPEFRRGFGFIRDLRGSAHPVGADTVVAIIHVVQQFWEQLGVRRAAIVTRPGVDAPAVMAHALAEEEDIPLRAFTSYDDAVEWLQADRG